MSQKPSIPKQTAPAVNVERVAQFIRSRFNPIRTLTPDALARYLDEFACGYLRNAALTWEAIEQRDDTVRTVSAKRKKAVARHGWEIILLDGLSSAEQTQAAEHQRVLNDFWNNIEVTNAVDRNQRGEVSLLARQMLDAVGKGYAAHEIVWRPSGGRLTAELRFVPLWFFENQTGALRFLESEYALTGRELEPNGWLVTVGEGLMPATSVAYIYKTMSLRDWVIYNERHGMPGIHGKTSAPENSTEWDALVTAVQNFAADWSLVTSEGASIEKLDLSTAGQLPYPPLVERMDRAISALWRGADLSTLSGQTSDAGQGASLQGDESDLLEADDAQLIGETLNRQVDRFVIEYHFGRGTRPLAYFKLRTAQKKNVEIELRIDQFLRDSGAPLGVRNALERYNRSVPEPNDEILQAPSSAGVGIPGTPLANAATVPALPDSSPEARPASPAPANPSREDPADIGLFLAAARLQLGEAQAEVLAPIRTRLADILAGPDSDLAPALDRLRAELPDLLKQISLAPETRQILEDTLAAALLNGLAPATAPAP